MSLNAWYKWIVKVGEVGVGLGVVMGVLCSGCEEHGADVRPLSHFLDERALN